MRRTSSCRARFRCPVRARDAETTGAGGEAEAVRACTRVACTRHRGVAVRSTAVAPACAAAGGPCLANEDLGRALGTAPRTALVFSYRLDLLPRELARIDSYLVDGA
jgi:hypothetical protein